MLEGAKRDYLTGFFTRDALEPLLEKLVLEDALKEKVFSIALFDLDHFKGYNDKYGHVFGDEILKYASSTLRMSFREDECYIIRYGGDEFIGIFPNKNSKETLQLVRQCNYNVSRRPFLFQNKLYKLSISCGIATFPSDAKTIEKLIQQADGAMYFSKHHGRNFTTIVSSIRAMRLRRNLILTLFVSMLLAALFLSYRLFFKKIIEEDEEGQILPRPENLDIIILKDGTVFEGYISEETNDMLQLELYLQKGKGTTVFNKANIAEIRYGSNSPAREK